LPNAAATFDDDFGFDKPARKAPRRPRAAAQKRPAKKKKKSPGFRFDMHKVARFAAIGMSASVALAIMVNALVLQKSRHPAPLFGSMAAIAPPPASGASPARTPSPAQAEVPAAREPADAPVAVPAARTRHAAADKPSEGDAIARLLDGGGVAASSATDKADSKTVLGVQRALIKLGFATKATGSLGPSTRKAIEAFEKDRHLPVKGELTHRLVKIIGAESGVRID
jgi:hypothetical protein